MLSLGGLPPFIGFFPKIAVIGVMGANSIVLMIAFLILRSLVTLYVYLSIFFFFYLGHRVVSKGEFVVRGYRQLAIFGRATLGLPQLLMI